LIEGVEVFEWRTRDSRLQLHQEFTTGVVGAAATGDPCFGSTSPARIRRSVDFRAVDADEADHIVRRDREIGGEHSRALPGRQVAPLGRRVDCKIYGVRPVNRPSW
jgi:hypothetical protein